MIDRKQSSLLWWAYRHVNGSISVKRYFDAGDLMAARESSFVGAMTAPFEALNREQAMEIAEARLG